jgi:[acyl-carrier-protein] S-malonyltransferase
MEPARKEFETFLVDYTFNNPSIKVLSNITGSEVRNVDEIKRLLVNQIVSPVRWIDCMRYAGAQGVTEFYECGPGKVLAGLARRIDRTWKVSSQYEFSGMAL